MWRWGRRIDKTLLLRVSLLAGAVGWALPGSAGAASSYATITKVTYAATQPSPPASCTAQPSLSGSGSESYTTPSEHATWEWTVPATLTAGASAHIKVTSQSFNNGGSDATIGMSAPAEFGTTPSSPTQVTAQVPVGAPGSAAAQQAYTFKPTRAFLSGEKLLLQISFGCANFVYEYTGHAASRGCSALADAGSALAPDRTCPLPVTPSTTPPGQEITSYYAPETYTHPLILHGVVPANAVSTTIDIGMSRDNGKLLNVDDFMAAVENGKISDKNVLDGASICANEYTDVRVMNALWVRLGTFARCVSVVAQILQRAENLHHKAIDAAAACRFRLAKLKGARHAPRVRLTCARTSTGVLITIRPADRGRKLRSLIGRSPGLIIGRLRSTEPVRPRDRVNVRWTTSKR